MSYPGDCVSKFDPQFETFCDEQAKHLTSARNDSLRLIYFSDNKPPIDHKSLDSFINFPEKAEKPSINGPLTTEKSIQWTKHFTDRKRNEFFKFLAERNLKI